MRYKYALSFVSEYWFHLDAWSEYGFALAHLVLTQPRYAAYYRLHHSGHVFLDNSFYERQEPLSVNQILEAAELIRPNIIQAPDWIGDADLTIAATVEMAERLPIHKLYAAAITGQTAEEMIYCYMRLRKIQPAPYVYCLPFKCPRVDFLKTLREIPIGDTRWHLFGFHNATELKECGQRFDDLGIHALTWDTAKLLSFAACSEYIFDPNSSGSLSGKAYRPSYSMPLSEPASLRYLANLKALEAALADSSGGT